MGIESTSEVWESTKPSVGRLAAFMRPRRRRGSSEKARSRWQFRDIAAARNQSMSFARLPGKAWYTPWYTIAMSKTVLQ